MRQQSLRIACFALITIALAFTAKAWAGDKETVLFNFQGGTYGSFPGSFVRDADGNFYGTLVTGGNPTCNSNCGLVYKLSPSGGHLVETFVHVFTGGADGAQPTSLFMDATGNLFVGSWGGGNGGCVEGCGTIVELSPLPGGGWSTTVVYSFSGSFDGAHPYLATVDAQGNLYGSVRSGQIFELSRLPGGKWKKKFLYLFDNSSGSYGTPWFVDASGDVYGTAYFGGNTTCSEGCGIVFELAPGPDGLWTESTLYSFTGQPDGAQPGMLVPDGKGNFFGLTGRGGTGTNCPTFNGCGTLFELSPSSSGYTETVLHNFNEVLDGWDPSGLVMDATGNLYLVTAGGVGGKGLVLKFALGTDGIWYYTTLYTFAGGKGGGWPGALSLDSSGDVYGIGGIGGSKNNGVLFELSPPAAESGGDASPD